MCLTTFPIFGRRYENTYALLNSIRHRDITSRTAPRLRS